MNTTVNSNETAHTFARVFYWVSVLLLLAGAYVLIDPFRRQPGETVHLYITFGAFELYMWLLLLLGRWQARAGLTRDAARSGILTAALTGMLFMSINEMHEANWTVGLWATWIAAVLALAKLPMARRWLGLRLPLPFQAACGIWVLMLAAPPAVIRALLPDYTAQHVAAYLACWLVAAIIGLHLLLVAWQHRRGATDGDGPMQAWWAPWATTGILAALAVTQLLVSMWGQFIDWRAWYFSPIAVATGVVLVGLALSRRQRVPEAIVALVVAMIWTGACWQIARADPSLPEKLPQAWRAGAAAYLVHPALPSGVLLTALLVLAAASVRNIWLLVSSAGPAALAGLAKGVKLLLLWRHGKGVAMLIGAFVLLGAGAMVQWLRTRRPPPEQTPDESGPTDNVATVEAPPPPPPLDPRISPEPPTVG